MIVLNFDFCYNIIKQIMFYTLGKNKRKIKIHLNPFHYINAFECIQIKHKY